MTLKTTEKNATITLNSLQKSDGTSQEQKMITEGEFHFLNGAFYITYQEENEGMGKSRVFLKITNDTVVMRRMGDFKTVICYEEGKITEFLYRVPFGDIEIKLKTKQIVNNLSETGGSLKLIYTLFTGSECTQNEIEFRVELKGEQK